MVAVRLSVIKLFTSLHVCRWPMNWCRCKCWKSKCFKDIPRTDRLYSPAAFSLFKSLCITHGIVKIFPSSFILIWHGFLGKYSDIRKPHWINEDQFKFKIKKYILYICIWYNCPFSVQCNVQIHTHSAQYQRHAVSEWRKGKVHTTSLLSRSAFLFQFCWRERRKRLTSHPPVVYKDTWKHATLTKQHALKSCTTILCRQVLEEWTCSHSMHEAVELYWESQGKDAWLETSTQASTLHSVTVGAFPSSLVMFKTWISQ